MPNFISCDYRQSSMVVINFDDQILPGTFEHALHHLIEHQVDLSAFHAHYRNDYQGRPAIDPAILLKIILFAYSKGITSSRQIQWCCHTNILFKALSCDTSPDFTTIAAFVSGHSLAIAALFEQVVLVCHQQGLIGHDLVAIDGCKLPSDAAKEWSGTLQELEHRSDKLRKQIDRKLEEHKSIDKLGERADTATRSQQVQKTINTLNSAHDKVVEFLSTAEKRTGQGVRAKEVKNNITDNESCKMTTSKGTIQGYNGIATVDSKHQIIIDAVAIGEGQEHHVFQPVVERIRNRYQRLGVSDDIYASGLTVTADTGYSNKSNVTYLYEQSIEGYVPDNQFRQRDPAFQNQKKKHGSPYRKPPKNQQKEFYSASDFQLDVERRQCLCPAGESLPLKRAGKDKRGNEKLFFQGRLLQCRRCTLKARCMRRAEAADTRTGHGRQVSFLLERSNKETDATVWMKQRVDSPIGKLVYAQRLAVVEPVFGNLRANKGLDRFF